MNGGTENFISFAEFELDVVHRRLRRYGTIVPIKAKTFDLLAFLVANNGATLSKDEILAAVWAGQFVEEANLSVQISALRKALGEKKEAPRFLLTIPGVGYRFVADSGGDNDDIIIENHKISRLFIESETEIPVSGFQPGASGATGGRTKTKAFSVIGCVVALIVFGAAAFWYSSLQKEDQPVVNAAAAEEEKQPKIKRLTNHGRVVTAALSPDGKFFAYSFIERGGVRTELRLGQIGGGETVLRPLADYRYVPKMFSADGGWLYYVAGEIRETKGALYKIPALGGVPQKLADNASIWLAVAPDEKQIAFIRHDRVNKTSALIVAEIDGTNEREIAVRPFDLAFTDDSQAWSADGQLIAVSAIAGANRKDATNNYYEVFVYRVSDGGVRQLTALEWDAVDTLEWLRDGSGLWAVAREKDKQQDLHLWQIDYPGGKAQLFSRDADSHAGELNFSADSKSLLAIQREIETNIWIAPAGGLKEARQVTFSSSGRQDGWYGMDWTADGRIVYTAWIDQSLTIWIMDANGANARQLTSNGFRDEKPAASADGQTVVFQSNRSGNSEIWSIDTDGGNLRQMTFTGGNSTPAVAPDGSWFVFRHRAADGRDSVWRAPVTGGEPILITENESFNPRVSPDGKSIACGYVVEGKTKLAVLPATGGAPFGLFDIPKTHNLRYPIRWSPDGRFITYTDIENGIWQQSIEGGAPQRLDGLPAEKTFSHSWSPDAKFLAFGRVRQVREAVLITDLR